MPRIRHADDVAIVDWGSELSVIGEIRSLVEGGAARRVLLNMAACDGMRADDLETLTEAFTVCEDRGCKIGMFGVSDAMARLVEVMDLAGDLPPVLGKHEAEALAALRGKAAENGRTAQPQQPIIDFDLDAAHAPTARFDPQQVVSGSAPAAAPAPTGAQSDGDLLAIDWTPLLATGYQLGGAGAERLTAGIGPVIPAPAPAPAPRPADVPTRAAKRPPIDDDVIDLGDVAPARVPVRDRGAFKTEVLPAFELDASGDSSDRAAARVLSGRGEDADFSPVDTGQGGPPAFLRQAQPPPVQPHPTPVQPPPAVRPPADRKSERLGRGPVAPAAFSQPPAPAPTQPPAAGGGAVNPYYEAASLMESDDQTVMIQPGMLDAAMLASVAMAEAAPPAPVAPAPTAPAPGVAASDEDEETVMFQPSALDAALLAEVAAVAGPESGVAAPRVEEPPPPASPPGLPSAAVAAVATANAAGEEPPPDARDVELRLFLHDHALSSTLHLQVLEKLVKSSEVTFGKTDLQLATGSPVGAVSTVLDQLVQSRLVRRTRSPRVRGGTGFILSASPQARNTLVRLLKAWQAPTSRAKVAGWLDGAA